MDIISECKRLINSGFPQEAIDMIDGHLSAATRTEAAALYYLRGNAYRKQQNWQMALNSYMEATARDPESPAREAGEMLMDILNFYHKDLYNP